MDPKRQRGTRHKAEALTRLAKVEDKFVAEVKARIRPDQKRALERIARDRELQLSDVLREAFRFYLNGQKLERV